MLIYKYVSQDALNDILCSQRIGFTKPRDFNDPFDQPRVSRDLFTHEIYDLFERDRWVTPIEQAEDAEKAWGECAVASFTRTYDNVLMWAHYADEHRGAVIEIDAVAAGLTSQELLIPVQLGSVIYLKRPTQYYKSVRERYSSGEPLVSRGEDRFEIDNLQGLQRMFLSKALPWAYEEEVRAVCEPWPYFQDQTTPWLTSRTRSGKTIQALQMGNGAITRVFVGLRFGELAGLTLQAEKFGFQIMAPEKQPLDGYEIKFTKAT